ncbi:MAG: hypothetical protein H7837_06640 [Magnetococcus sp. MYC-9]
MATRTGNRGWMGVCLVATLATGAVTLPRTAQAEWFWESWFSSATPQSVARPGGLAVYNTPARSWGHLPSTVYASVPTVEGRYPVASQHAAVSMPVQTVPVQPVIVQSRPAGVYGGIGE